jgi:hypothetical protein
MGGIPECGEPSRSLMVEDLVLYVLRIPECGEPSRSRMVEDLVP